LYISIFRRCEAMKQKSKIYMIEFFTLVLCALVTIGICVVKVDPFFHYHKPLTDTYFYVLDNQRSQNEGITKHFEYNALITGTSMTENFKTSEFDRVFGVNAIKIPYSGGSYKEINDNLIRAFEYNPDLKIIVRGLDMSRFFDDKDMMRYDLGTYPTYLYDKSYLNDVNYIFNRDVIFEWVYPMITDHHHKSVEPGITSFDEYSNWMSDCAFGYDSIMGAHDDGYHFDFQGQGNPSHLTEEEKKTVSGNVRQNITTLAKSHPDATFYYFITPYSILWWKDKVEDGTIYKQIEAEQIIIEEILKCPNIRLYSFNNSTDLVTDLNNYTDSAHYGEWINSLMLRWMHDGKYLLTKDNYKAYLSQELQFYTSYNYNSIPNQQDYESDYYAAALWNKEINNVEPFPFSDHMLEQGELQSAEMECKICLDDITDYHYLVFYGKKNSGDGQPSVLLYDQNGKTVDYEIDSLDLDDEWHQHAIDVSQLSGKTDIIFHGGGMDTTGSADTSYTFSDITLY